MYVNYARVNVGGILDVVCFDKTGTLTEDGLDVLGVRVVQRPELRYFNNDNDLLMLIEARFSDILSDPSIMLPGAAYQRDPTINYAFHRSALYTMATCHSLHQVEGELVGDPLDVKMFEFTGWSFEESGQIITGAHDEELVDVPSAVARPSAGMEFGIGGTHEIRPVRQGCLSNATAAPLNQSLDLSD